MQDAQLVPPGFPGESSVEKTNTHMMGEKETLSSRETSSGFLSASNINFHFNCEEQNTAFVSKAEN